MAVDRSSNNQATSGSGMSTALATSEEERIKRQQELGEEASTGASSGPATIGGSSATQTSAPVKAMPKQQKAGTGTFANLRSYLEAAQGGGQQKVAQAATQQVQKLGAGAQKGVQQAQESFKGQLGAGSGALFKGAQPGEFLSAEDVAKQAQTTTGSVLGTARGVTYQAPQQTPTELREQYFKDLLGDKYQDFVNDRSSTVRTISTMDRVWNPDTGTFGPSITKTFGEDELYAKYGIDKSKIPTQQTPITTQPQQYFKPEDLEAFANVINAQYQGPASLQQAGLYEQAARKTRAAQQAGELTQTAGGREQLLRDVFGRGRDYSRGASRLDALLLNASEQGIQQLQQQAQPALQAQQALQAAQNLSANEAAQRARDIERIRTGARTAFTEARTAEETAAQDYIQSVQDQWNQLPEYFKGLLSTARTPTEQLELSAEEAALLGLQGGQSLFGVTPESLQAAQMATGAELITKDQLSRQLALAQLAGLDKLGGLKKDLMYSDLEKAGTKNILSSLDVGSLQRDLAEREAEALKKIDKLAKISTRAYANTPRGNIVETSPYNLLELLKSQGKYTPVTPTETLSADYLKTIAEGGTLPENSAVNLPDVQQNIRDYLTSVGNTPYYTSGPRGPVLVQPDILSGRSGDLIKANWQSSWIDPLTKAGFTRDVALADNETTKARAAALRQLLKGIYKT